MLSEDLHHRAGQHLDVVTGMVAAGVPGRRVTASISRVCRTPVCLQEFGRHEQRNHSAGLYGCLNCAPHVLA